MIPCDVFDDFKMGLAVGGDIHLHRSRRVFGIALNVIRTEIEILEAVKNPFSQLILAHSTCRDASISKLAGVVSEVRRSAAHLRALREKVPKNFSQADDCFGGNSHGSD